jgi:hypothetical protein
VQRVFTDQFIAELSLVGMDSMLSEDVTWRMTYSAAQRQLSKQLFQSDGKVANAFAGRVEHGISYSRGNPNNR